MENLNRKDYFNQLIDRVLNYESDIYELANDGKSESEEHFQIGIKVDKDFHQYLEDYYPELICILDRENFYGIFSAIQLSYDEDFTKYRNNERKFIKTLINIHGVDVRELIQVDEDPLLNQYLNSKGL